MLESLYTMEKMRELESQIKAARPRHAVASAGFGELVAPVLRAALLPSRLTGALCRGGRMVENSESAPARHPALDALLEG
jgi:hypothetical protein